MDLERYKKSGIIEQYVLGFANSDERAEVEHMAKKYPEIDKYICELQNSLEQYAEMHAAPPPPRLKSKIINQVNGETETVNEHAPSPVRYRTSRLLQWGVGIAAMMIVGLSGLCFLLYKNQNEARNQMTLLSTQMKHIQSDYEQLKERSDDIKQRYVVLKDTGTRHVKLHGSAHAPQAQLVVYWNPDHNKGFLNIIDMPAAPKDHQYQVWADVSGKHVNMGVLEPNADGNILHTLPYIENSKGFVITLEKEGGSEHPNVEQMYAHGVIEL